MIHIVFQEADTEVLKKAMELDESLAGEIFLVRDDFAVGPLESLETEEGWKARTAWWKNLLDQSPYAAQNLAGSFDDRETVKQAIEKIEGGADAWIWMGQNTHDVCGYFWLIPQLQAYQGKIVVLYLNNLPFINEKGQIFYPVNLHEIQPREFLKAKKLNRKVTLSEFETDPDEWNRLVSENSLVRILEGGKKIVGRDEDHYDREILTCLSPEWQKGNRAIHQLLSKMKSRTGDVFIIWRLRKLAEEGRVEISGNTSGSWKDFEVRLKTASPEITENATPAI